MRKNHLFLLITLLCSIASIQAQKTDIKYYPKTSKAGEVGLLYSYGEYRNGISSKLYVIDVPKTGSYYLNSLANMELTQSFKVYVDKREFEKLPAETNGWQLAAVKDLPMQLSAGMHEIRFEGVNAMVPMVDEIYLSTAGAAERVPEAAIAFIDKVNQLKQQPVITLPCADEPGGFLNKVLPNPEGLYNHAIDTAFAYTHFSIIYLTPGNHSFATSGSTVSRSLAIFHISSFSYSWANANGGPGGESLLNFPVASSGYYVVMLRPTVNGTTGTTTILHNGSTMVSGAVIGGKTYYMGSLKGGPLNLFTCRLTAGDTRMIASRYTSSSARGYNDDYGNGGGDFAWGVASRIKKDFTGDSVQYGFVCAYSPTAIGKCDIYLGNENSNVYAENYPEFPLLKADDVIKAASSTGYYNCISWSGGITSDWVWPPSLFSTYNCSNSQNDITCFDNFYANMPVRYPGAWNYTRTGATSGNSVVDLWKLTPVNGTPYFTHASVTKPGNNHPHGYDWESKPGSLTRTFHPRNALTNNAFGYGAVSNYYKSTGTYARDASNAFESADDAVKAGLAVYENALLSNQAGEKLRSLMNKVASDFTSQFNRLYEAWKKTWEANAMYSDPAAYCKNPEFKALAKFSQGNIRHAMLLVFDKFISGDHLITELLLLLTREKYIHLLDEVKAERAAAPNDEQGRYKIHGDHDNGVLYIEKILKQLEPEPELIPVSDMVNIVVSPNPVKDRLTVQVTTLKAARVFVKAISTQTLLTKVMQAETELPAGTHRFSMDVQGFAGNTGDIIAVQVIVDGQLKTVKVLMVK